MIGHDGADDGGEEARDHTDSRPRPLSDDVGEDVDADLAPAAGGRQGAQHPDPEHQHPQQGITPGDARVEEVAQDDLQRRQQDDEAEDQGQEAVLQAVEQAEGALEPLAGCRVAHRGSGCAARYSSRRRRISEIIVSE